MISFRILTAVVTFLLLISSTVQGGPPVGRAPVQSAAATATRLTAAETAATVVKPHGNSNASSVPQTQYNIAKVDSWKQVPTTTYKTGISGVPNKSSATLSPEKGTFVSGATYNPRGTSQLPKLNGDTTHTEGGRFSYIARNMRTIEEQPFARAVIKSSEQNTVTMAKAKEKPLDGNKLPTANPASYWNPNPSRIKVSK